MRTAALLVAVLAACGSRSGASGSSPPPQAPSSGRSITVGCLEVAIAGAPDSVTVGPAVQMEVANGCEGVVLVDVREIAAHGLDAEGRAYLLRPHRIDGNVQPLRLGAHSISREVIGLQVVGDPARRLVTTCLDLQKLDRSRGDELTGRREVCVPASPSDSTVAEGPQ